MLRGKVFNKENKEIYRVLNIDFENKIIVCRKKGEIFSFDFSKIVWLECTGYVSKNSYIYYQDFIIAKKENSVITGIVKRKNSKWILENKLRGNCLSLKNLRADGYKFINLGNASLYFKKNKAKKKSD